jgi:hypothetical protein
MGASAGFLLAQARDACGETASIKEKKPRWQRGLFPELRTADPEGITIEQMACSNLRPYQQRALDQIREQLS